MKTISNSVFRSVFAILLGLVLVLWPEATIIYLVMTIGICFILPGIFTLVSYFMRDKGEFAPAVRFPLEGAGSILLGTWLVITPAFFVNILMYILGALLLLAGLQQIIMLIRARKWSTVPFGFYLMPLLIFITGITILAYPFGAAANVFVVFGAASIVYGAIELLNEYKFGKRY